MAIYSTLNGQSYPMLKNNMVCFTDVPNIWKFYTTGSSETFSEYRLSIPDPDQWFEVTTVNGQWTFSVDGDTIENFLDPENINGKRFWVSEDAENALFSIANALRNCQNVNSTYKIYYDADAEEVVLRARRGGKTVSNIDNQTGDFLSVAFTSGNTNNDLNKSKIYIDVFDENDDYITSMMKNAYGDSVAFDLSPVMASMADYGVITPLRFEAYVVSRYSAARAIETLPTNTTYGFKTSYSNNYSDVVTGECHLAEAIENQGTPLELYVYDNSIPLSFINDRVGQTYDLTVQYLDATGAVLSSDTQTITFQNQMQDVTVSLNANSMRASTSVKVLIPNGYVQYKVIKPLKATVENHRLYWRNEYGGISFFDFTGQYSTEHSMEGETYQISTLGYYDRLQDSHYNLNELFSRGYSVSHTVNTHLLPEAGTWLFESLSKSKKVWVSNSGSLYDVIIDEVNIEEQDVEGVFLVTVQYHYSLYDK